MDPLVPLDPPLDARNCPVIGFDYSTHIGFKKLSLGRDNFYLRHWSILVSPSPWRILKKGLQISIDEVVHFLVKTQTGA